MAALVVEVPVIIPSGPDSGRVSELLLRGKIPSARGCAEHLVSLGTEQLPKSNVSKP